MRQRLLQYMQLESKQVIERRYIGGFAHEIAFLRDAPEPLEGRFVNEHQIQPVTALGLFELRKCPLLREKAQPRVSNSLHPKLLVLAPDQKVHVECGARMAVHAHSVSADNEKA